MKTKLMALAFALIGSASLADTMVVQGEVVTMNPVRSYISESIPQQVCHNVRVTNQYRQDNQVSGAVIGAIIGNQFGNGSGKDAMTVLGAILGADQGRKNSNVRTETTNQVECFTEWTTVRTRYRHGFEVVIFDGSQYLTFHSNERFRYGDIVTFYVQVQ
jgi:uncharacterized protein YcfJ